MFTRPQKGKVLIGYLLVLISSLGFYSIYLDSQNESSSLLTWMVPMLIGIGILIWKNLKLDGKFQLKMVIIDLILLLNFFVFSFLESKYGLNYLISGIIGATIIIFTINQL